MRTLELLNYETIYIGKLYKSRGNDIHLLEKRKDMRNDIVFPHATYSNEIGENANKTHMTSRKKSRKMIST